MGATSDAAESLQRAGCWPEAEAAYRRVLRETPGDARVLSNYGGLLNELCRFDEALDVLGRAVSIDRRCWGAWSNLGNCLVEMQRYDEAVAAFGTCLRINPGHGLALSNMGVALQRRGDLRGALRFLELAVRAEPANAETRCNLGQTLLAAGDLRRGFVEYEWRWRTEGMRSFSWAIPRWQGEEFSGRTLLLHEEGGFGDTLQFVRFAEACRARGGRVVLRSRPELASLLGRMPALDGVVGAEGSDVGADLQCPLLSLPMVLGTTLDTVPGASGYLTADPALVSRWRKRLPDDGTMRVGLVWAGSPRQGFRGAALADRRRSVQLATFAPLARAEVTFFSLQVGEASSEALAPPAGMRLVDLSGGLGSFDDTAAIVSCLDLVIAVDTSTAHLAGALGRPVWMMSRFDGCWRWMSERDDSPWYRSMRIYRQEAPGDWSAPLTRMAGDLGAALSADGERQFGARRVLPA